MNLNYISYSFLYLFLCISYVVSSQDNSLQSPSDFLGYELGSRFTRHADVIRYFQHVSEQSPMAHYDFYGKTYEYRDLSYAIVTTVKNHNALTTIRTENLQQTGILNGQAAPQIAIVWLSYNVHGNEASSSEAAMQTIYELLTVKQSLLENTVVIIDPCLNPDGRDRYVNWYNQTKSTPYNTQQDTAEHHEPWPGGRSNHYLFDLNRDWAWANQIETQQRLKIYNQWMPHVHVDFHEQGINEPYYFAPAAAPYHEDVTSWQVDFQTQIGQNHARYFDEKGWLYFTKEQFDLFYPSYGDTYPTFMGAIGMTYEQAGHGRAGLGIQTDEGHILTLQDRILHHTQTGLSTVEIASRNAQKLNQEFRNFFKPKDHNYKSYVLSGEKDRITQLKKLLQQHDIQFGTPNTTDAKGYDYAKRKETSFKLNGEELVVSTDQPKGTMIKVLMEPQAKIMDSLTYDITAWSIPYAYGLRTFASKTLIPNTIVTTTETTTTPNVINQKAVGYVSKWNNIKDAQFLTALLQEKIKVRFSEKPFKNRDEKFDRGSLIITKSDHKKTKDFHKKVITIANKHGRKLTAITSGFVGVVPNLGSPNIKLIKQPRIGILRGPKISSLNYGELWHFFETQLYYPVTAIGTDYFEDITLSDYDILLLPSGDYETLFPDDAHLKKLKDWIKKGGKLIAIGEALSTFIGKKDFELKKNKGDENEEEEGNEKSKKPNLISYEDRERNDLKKYITGAIFESTVDNTHPMAFGYDKHYFSLKLDGESSYSLLSDGYNIAYLDQDTEVISGFAGSEALQLQPLSLVFGEQPMDDGSVLYLADNPLFRSFWEHGKLFLVNAIFFTNTK